VNPQSRALQRRNRRVSTAARPLYAYLNLLQSVATGRMRRLLNGTLRGKGRTLTRTLKTNGSRRTSADYFAINVCDRHQRIVECCFDVRDSTRHIPFDGSFPTTFSHDPTP